MKSFNRLSLLCVFLLLNHAPGFAKSAPEDCPVGIYRNPTSFAIKYDKGRSEIDSLPAYVTPEGKRGHLRANTSAYCYQNTLIIEGEQPFEYQAITEKDKTFVSQGLRLSGRLLTSDSDAESPLVVLVHGSERAGMLNRSYMPYMLAAQGLQVFFYDKRGTGLSDGQYTQNFEVLANDAVNGLATAKSMLTKQDVKVGYMGFSQGGWVAPLAATKYDADFVTVAYGLVIAPVEEDAEQVFSELREKGYSQEVIKQARDITDATATIVGSRFNQGQKALLSLKQQYAKAPWFNQIEGEYTGELLRASPERLMSGNISDLKDAEIDWNHDAIGVLRSLSIPQTWLLAGSDREAPGDLTKQRLLSLQLQGARLTLFEFPNTDHGMLEFAEDQTGKRTYTGYAKGYFKLLADSVLGRLSPPYGNSELLTLKPN